MFMERGFDAVTVTEIAESVEIAASTIYRHFTTKEAIVLWDEHEDAVVDALTRASKHNNPLDAMRLAFVETYGGRYDDDLDFQLRRVKYIYETEALHAAAIESDLADREELSHGLARLLSKPNRNLAPLLSGAAMLALDVAFDNWQRGNAKRPLGQLIDEAFTALAKLADIR